MKQLSIIIAIVCIAGVAAADQVWSIRGTVLSVLDDGILITQDDNRQFGRAKPNPGEVVFLRGKFNVVDDTKVAVEGIPEESVYKYTTVQGAVKTIRAFVPRATNSLRVIR